MGDDSGCGVGSSSGSWLIPGALAVGSALACAGIALQPPKTGPVAAVFPPWWGTTRSVIAAAASGSVLDVGRFGFVVIVARDRGSPDWPRGAWLAVDPRAFGGCLVHRPVMPG